MNFFWFDTFFVSLFCVGVGIAEGDDIEDFNLCWKLEMFFYLCSAFFFFWIYSYSYSAKSFFLCRKENILGTGSHILGDVVWSFQEFFIESAEDCFVASRYHFSVGEVLGKEVFVGLVVYDEKFSRLLVVGGRCVHSAFNDVLEVSF